MDKFKLLLGVVFTLVFLTSHVALSQVEPSNSNTTGSVETTETLNLPPPTEEIQEILLPQHWRQQWLDEPIFNNKVHVIETGEITAPTLLLVHGLGYNGLLDWLAIIPELEEKYHVVALDLPGFGQSDPTALQLAPQKYAQLLAWLVPQFSPQPVTVIGHSMGAAISLRFAAAFPALVDKLIMVDTAGVLQRSVFVFHMTQVPNRYAWLDSYAGNFKPLDEAVSRVTNFINRWRVSLISGIDKYPDPAKILMENEFAQQYVYKNRSTLNAALGLVYEDLSSSIEQLEAPTHIIWGRTDRVAPLRTGKLLARQLKNAQLHIIDDAGHVPMHDQPEQFVTLLTHALSQAPIRQMELPQSTGETQDYSCYKQRELEISGNYKHISLKNCRYINLRNVRADSITIDDSIVNIENSTFQSATTALTSIKSRLTMTNVDLRGEVAMLVDDSLVDSAGVVFTAKQQAIKLESESQLYFSVSSVIESGQKSRLHGMSIGKHFSLE